MVERPQAIGDGVMVHKRRVPFQETMVCVMCGRSQPRPAYGDWRCIELPIVLSEIMGEETRGQA
jgi:hypothetical protein